MSFIEGDTELARCVSKVHEMQAVCQGFSYIVASNSTYMQAYSKLCSQVCTDCAKACRKHDQHHECRACAKACEELVEEIRTAWS